jgi:pimeloyl-ACP methyl ester carboxylesterase
MTHASPIVLIPSQLCTEVLFQEQLPSLCALAPTRVSVQREHDSVGAMAQSVLESAAEKFSLIAHGMGGFVAFEILRRAPWRVAGLALLGSLAPDDTPAQTARREGYLKLVESGKFDQVVEERISLLFHPKRQQDPRLLGIARGMAKETGAQAFLRQQRAIMTRPDSRPMLASIPCPVLLLYGDSDGVSTRAHQDEMLAAIPNAQLEIVEACGHMMSLEEPARVTAVLARWTKAL